MTKLSKPLPFEKSFASVRKSKYLSPKNNVDPRYLSRSSHVKYIFNCNKCHHEFDISLNTIVAGSFCPFCKNRRLCQNIDCVICEEKSFQSSPYSQYWSLQNLETP